MNVTAVCVEPEFLTLKPIDDDFGGLTLTLELARFEVTEAHNLTTGSLQVHLLSADVDNLATQLSEFIAAKRADLARRTDELDEAR